jgi:HAD superfamily hydrolase (TIGR01549 family)
MHPASLEKRRPAPRRSPSVSVGGVLVDLDDTIFDHSLTCRAAIASLRQHERWLRAKPLEAIWTEYLRRLNDDFERIGSYVGRPGLSVPEARAMRWRTIARGCGVDLSAEAAREVSAAYHTAYRRHRRAVPGARALVRSLHRDVRVAVVTNNELAEQEEKVRFLGIGDSIDALVVSQAVGAAKPDRRIFDAALKAIGIPASQASMLGDSWESDVVGARGAGVRPVWFNRFGLPPAGSGRCDVLRSLRPSSAARAVLLGGLPRSRSPPARLVPREL